MGNSKNFFGVMLRNTAFHCKQDTAYEFGLTNEGVVLKWYQSNHCIKDPNVILIS